MDTAQSEKESGRKQFTTRDFSLMCDWLQVDGNLECVKGSDGKTKVGARYPNKKQAFGAMAQYINKNQIRGSDLAAIDSQGARNRFTNLMTKYKRTKAAVGGTGWGLTPEDERNGVTTIEAKLDKLCHCYSRLDAIMGGQPEVDTAGNLYNAPSIPNSDGTMPMDILSSVGVDDVDDVSFLDDLDDASNFTEFQRQPNSVPSKTEKEHVIDLDQDTTQPIAAPQSVPAAQVRSPTTPGRSGLAGTTEDSANDDRMQPSTTSVQIDPTPSKLKPSRFGSAKKRPPERSGGVTGTFAASMESLSEGKLQGNLIKERALEAKLLAAEQVMSMRGENTKRQLEIEASKLKHEEKRLEHSAVLEAKRLKQAHRSEDRKLELQEKKAKRQARISLMKSNKHRSPEEIEKLLSMMETNLD